MSRISLCCLHLCLPLCLPLCLCLSLSLSLSLSAAVSISFSTEYISLLGSCSAQHTPRHYRPIYTNNISTHTQTCIVEACIYIIYVHMHMVKFINVYIYIIFEFNSYNLATMDITHTYSQAASSTNQGCCCAMCSCPAIRISNMYPLLISSLSIFVPLLTQRINSVWPLYLPIDIPLYLSCSGFVSLYLSPSLLFACSLTTGLLLH